MFVECDWTRHSTDVISGLKLAIDLYADTDNPRKRRDRNSWHSFEVRFI